MQEQRMDGRMIDRASKINWAKKLSHVSVGEP